MRACEKNEGYMLCISDISRKLLATRLFLRVYVVLFCQENALYQKNKRKRLQVQIKAIPLQRISEKECTAEIR